MTDKQAINTFYSLKNIAITLLIVISTGWITYRYFTAPPPGFCVEQNRVLLDTEYFKFVTDTSAYSHDQKVSNGKYSVIDCCIIERRKGDFLSKILRVDEGVYLSWRYERTEQSRNNHDPTDKHYGVIQMLDSCATRILDETGMTEK